MNRNDIVMRPIGVIRTPYKEPEGMPIQGVFDPEVTGRVEVDAEYRDGLRDLDGFSHAILIFHFHRAGSETLTRSPYLEDAVHGIFAVRSPRRPNNIGFSIVRLEQADSDGFTFSEVDILDQTPLLDIKPYVFYFDHRKDVRNGWIEKHFAGGSVPGRTRLPGPAV